MTQVKICGITSVDDARVAVDAGADLIGLNFVPGSPRRLSLDMAERIASRVGGVLERVAVFQNASWDEIERVTRRIDIERIQLHGDETEQDVELLDYPVIKAVRGADRAAAETYPGTLLLLDHPTRGGYCVFGKVKDDASMAVVDTIRQTPTTGPEKSTPLKVVKITKATIVSE